MYPLRVNKYEADRIIFVKRLQILIKLLSASKVTIQILKLLIRNDSSYFLHFFEMISNQPSVRESCRVYFCNRGVKFQSPIYLRDNNSVNTNRIVKCFKLNFMNNNNFQTLRSCYFII